MCVPKTYRQGKITLQATPSGKEPRKGAKMSDITYTRYGDYLLPNIILNDPSDAEPLTKYGIMRKNFLKSNKPALYGKMLCHEELYPHCREVQQQAYDRLNMLMAHLTASNPPPLIR